MSNDWKAEEIKRRYAPTPDEPRHRKKARKRHVRSDHKHEYERVAIDTHTSEVGKTGRRKVYHSLCKNGAIFGKLSCIVTSCKRESNNIVAKIFLPVGRNSRHTVENTEGRSNGRTGTVGIVSAVDGVDHGLLEVALSPEQTDNRIGNV